MASFGSSFRRWGVTSVGILGAASLFLACSASSDGDLKKKRPTPGEEGGGGDGGGDVGKNCDAGEWVCSGATAKLCDGEGGFSDQKDCAAEGKVCGAGYGCVTCVPGGTSCDGNIAKVCNGDGTGYASETVCDEFQGMQCSSMGCSGVCSPEALGDSYIGCDYYPTVTLNPVGSIFSFAVAVGNGGDKPASILVTKGGQDVASRIVPPGGLEIIRLPWVPALKGPDAIQSTPQDPGGSRVVKDGAYRLRSTQPVTVYQFNPLEYTKSGDYSYSNDASLLLPATTMTSDYTVLSWPSSSVSASFYSVVATQNGTTVHLKGSGPAAAGGGVDGAGNGSVTLDAGDVLSVIGAHDVFTSGDLTGARVQANKPVQVIAGHSCANVPSNKAACDHIEETMFPVETLGKDYLVTFPAAPGSGNKAVSPHTLRIAAILPNTKVSFDPPIRGEATISPGTGFLEIPKVTQDVRITADQAIIVGQYMHGAEDVPSGKGDPSLSLGIATEQYRKSYIFLAPNSYDQNYVNIVAKVDSTVTLNGDDVTGFEAIGSSGYGVKRHALSKTEVYSATSSEPFGIVVYGYGEYTSYMYPGGLDLEKITEVPK